MDKKILIGIIAVIAIVAIAAAAVMLMNGGNSDDKHDDDFAAGAGKRVGEAIVAATTPNTESRLWVYGNANEDDRINNDDLAYLKDIVAGKKTKTCLADTNADGVVNDKDVTYLEHILAANSETKIDIYYIDDYVTLQKVSWPVKGIAISYCSGLYAADCLGLMDKVVLINDEIKNYPGWQDLNSKFKTLKSSGTVSSPDWEAILASKADVYVPGYFSADADSIARTQLAGIDVMFKHTCDGATANLNIDRSLVMEGYLLQGDLNKTYKWLDWHDGIMKKIRETAAKIADKDKVSYVMTRSYYDPATATFSFTGGNQIDTVHAKWSGAKSITEGNALTPNNYNSLTQEQILTLFAPNVGPDNTIYLMMNEHDGFRHTRELADDIKSWPQVFESAPYDVHYMGMSRDLGNAPFYMVELVFYQNVMYPELDNGLDYAEIFDYFIENFTDQPENYKKIFQIDHFIKDFGTDPSA